MGFNLGFKGLNDLTPYLYKSLRPTPQEKRLTLFHRCERTDLERNKLDFSFRRVGLPNQVRGQESFF